MNSNELFGRLKAGNHQAFAELYDKYAPALFGIILRIVKSQEPAEKILGETFIKIIQDIQTTQNSVGPFGWMSRIARSLAMESMSPIARMTERLEADDAGLQMIGNSYNQLIDGMETSCKDVFDNLYFQGHSLVQTCEILSIPIEKGRSLLKSAFDHISCKLNSGHGNGVIAGFGNNYPSL